MKTISVPQPVGAQPLDALRAALQDIQSERQRLAEFTANLSQEWQQIRIDLQHCQMELSEQKRILSDQEQRLNRDRANLDSDRDAAGRAAHRLDEMEQELHQSRQHCQEWDAQCLLVRQQLREVHEGFSSLDDFVALVQSTQVELQTAAESLRERASRLSDVLTELPSGDIAGSQFVTEATATVEAQTEESSLEADVAPTDSETLVSADAPCITAQELSVHESECLGDQQPPVEDASGNSSQEPDNSADPVVGSVLAELARFVKSESGCWVLGASIIDSHRVRPYRPANRGCADVTGARHKPKSCSLPTPS